MDETKQKILDYVLKNSPYGETNEVIKGRLLCLSQINIMSDMNEPDLRKLVSDFGLYE